MMKVAMLSYWHVHASDYTRQAQKHRETEIVAVWDEVSERGQARSNELNVPFYSSLDELLANDDIDGVIVDAPTNLHREVMLKAANARKHIFTEKVLAPTLAEANDIVRAIREAGVKLTVSLRRMNEPYTPPIRDLLNQGLLEQVTFVRIRDAHNGASGGWLVDHFFNKEQTYGGALIDLGCHPMYLTRLFLGLPESVNANYGFLTGKDVEDNAVSVLRYANGALGVVETGFVTPFSPFTIEIYGTHGSIVYGMQGDKLLLRSTHSDGAADNEWTEVPLHSRPSAFEQWVNHIQNDTFDEENLEIAVDLTRLMEASNKSAAENRVVSLQELRG